jgi:hypothetical protein
MAPQGCYIVIAPSGDVTPESSEIKALRMAVAIGGKSVFVKWGQSVDNTVSAGSVPHDEPTQAEPKARAARKKAEPAETPAVQPEPVPAMPARSTANDPLPSPVDDSSPDNF